MPGSRKKIEEAGKKFPIWIPIAAVLAAAGILLYIFWWPVPADQAYDLSLETKTLTLTIEDGQAQETALVWTLKPKSAWLRSRAKKSFAETALIWSSSDPNVAAVDADGKVRAVEKGNSLITGQFGSLTVSCPAEVYYPLKGLTLSAQTLTLQKNDGAYLTVAPLPDKAELPSGIRFSSSDPAVVRIDDAGNLTAAAVGTAVLTAEGGGFSNHCTVTVLSAMTGIRIEDAPAVMNVGESVQLPLKYIPEDTTDDRTVRWESSAPDLAAVDADGLVQALAPGKVTIRAAVGPYLAETEIEIFAPLLGIFCEPAELLLLRGEEAQLQILFDPENTTDDTTVLFSSSDPGLVSVDENGRITALDGGMAQITAQVGPHTALCAVMVRVPMTGLVIDGTNLTLKRGETAALSVSFFPEDTNDDRTLLWISDAPEVASVDENGVVTAENGGDALITVSCGEFSDRVRITVTVPAEEVRISRDSLHMNKEESASLSAEVLPEDTTEGRDISWSSSDSSVVTVDGSGRLYAVAPGECTIRAEHGNLSASCRVQVSAPLRGISLNRTDVTLIAGDPVTLSVEYIPRDTTDDRTVTWSSSDNSVATVNGGRVQTLSAGTCTVTAQVGGCMASAVIRVKPLIRVSGVTLSQSSISFTDYGQRVKLSATVSPGDATYPSVRWSSSNTSVAAVESDGTVRVTGSGSCTVTATADGVSASCQVSSSLPPPKVVVVLDPGHGGPWSGATASWNGETVLEADLTQATAYACKYYLETHYVNLKVYLTRYDNDDIFRWDDVDEDMQARAAWASGKGADLLVCLHYNAGGSGGTEVYASVAPVIREASYKLAVAIRDRIVALGYFNRGVFQRVNDNGRTDDYYGILRYCAWHNLPAVLVEHCFMDNAEDFFRMGSRTEDLTNAMGIADALGIAE